MKTTIIQISIIISIMSWSLNGYSQSTENSFMTLKKRTTYQSITSTEQMMWYVNAQNLINEWNNIIVDAKTGEEQLKTMDESGVFAKDIKLTFNFGGELMNFTGLTDEPLSFYSNFVDPLKKKRTNIASNPEVVEFGNDFLILNFKHFIFFDETLSLVGQNQLRIERKGSRYFISKAYIEVRLANLEHGY